MASIAPEFAQNRGLLQELLHSLSQPLTTLHCTLEHSLEHEETGHAGEVALALEQTDHVIELVRLMREYVEAETGCFLAEPFPLGLAIENVLEQLSVLAEARKSGLFAYGASMARIPVRGIWLQRALLYLVGALLEFESSGSAITILLEDGPSHSFISGHCLPMKPTPDGALEPSRRSPEANTSQQVKIEIARRVLGSSGASVDFYANGRPGFFIRLPKASSGLVEIPA
ncbi:MAG TPA: hypothetical protein VMI10_25645 [Terriglobales bacterium]|nr:hypothetical protein [Terriglobales bacterium]